MRQAVPKAGGGRFRHTSRLLAGSAIALSAVAAIVGGATQVGAKGGTAKPPTITATPTVTILPPAGPVLQNFPPTPNSPLSGNRSNGFSIVGNVQSVTGPACPATPGTSAGPGGGTVTVNGVVITIPANTIVQYPANTVGWGDAVCGISAVKGPIALDGTGPTIAASPIIYPGVEIRVEGNIVAPANAAAGVGSPHIGALVYISQQSLNSGSGYISFIDYNDGSIYVSTTSGETRLLINDPTGRFGIAKTSTDARFSVDSENPTIKSGASGYPMCVPRPAPAAGGAAFPTVLVNGVAIPNDPLCPVKNRPISDGTTTTCRNFGSAGIAFRVAGADIVPSPAGTPCSGFVMKAIKGMPGTGALTAANLAGGAGAASMGKATGPAPGQPDPDPSQQAPFMVGDFITWSGTLVRGGNALAPVAARPTTTTDVVWVHTINANVGVYTQPSTLPAYVAVGEMGIGVDPSPTAGAVLVGVEATARVFLEANTSDIGSIVDIYLDDKGFSLPAATPKGPLVSTANSEYFRWLTLETMTGTLADQAAQASKGVAVPISAQPFGGGIYTQFIGPQPGRARIRANKVPAIDPTLTCPTTASTIGGTQGCAVTQSPTRYVRVVLRSLCAPAASSATSSPAVPATNIDEGTAATAPMLGRFFNINGTRAALTGAGAGNGTCLQSANFANGLFTGQYMAPVGEYIFPENTLAGFPVVPFNFWHLGFLGLGEQGVDGNSAAPQAPRPW